MGHVAGLLERVRREGNPLIDGETVTFVWKGRAAPQLLDDLHGWEDGPRALKRHAPGVWAVSFDLPLDAYLEYAFYDPKSRARLRDPFNPPRVNNGVGSYNHYIYMPEAAPSPLTRPARGIRRGTLAKHGVESWMLGGRGKRAVHLYRPPVDEAVPLLVVYDGTDYLRRGRLDVIVDNLIAQRRIRPIAMALLQNGGEARRFMEYAGSDATLSWLRHEVLPLARRELSLLDSAGSFGVLGASMGGLMAMYTGLRLPETFGKIFSQSGVFEFEGRDCAVVDLIRHAPRPEVKIFMDAGKLEWLLADNRRMQPLLHERGYDLIYHETGGAHNFTTWRNDLPRGLEALFGG